MRYSLSILLAFGPLILTSAFLDDLYDGLSNTGTFLKDALHTLKRAHDFAESLIDEDCNFTDCSFMGLKTAPNPAHVKSANGCGSLNLIFDETDASPVRLDKEFTGCCNEHDFCYDTCGSDKDICDLKLKRCLYQVCRSTGKTEMMQVKCKVNAKAAYLMVMSLGCPLFRESQKEACICVDKKNPKNEL